MEQIPALCIDVMSIPDFRREELAKGALALTAGFFDAGSRGTLPSMAQRAQGQTKKGRPGPPCKRKECYK